MCCSPIFDKFKRFDSSGSSSETGNIWIYLDFYGMFTDHFTHSKDLILRVLLLKLEIFGFIWIFMGCSPIILLIQKIWFFGFFFWIWKYLDLFGFLWDVRRSFDKFKRFDSSGSSSESGNIWIYLDFYGMFADHFPATIYGDLEFSSSLTWQSPLCVPSAWDPHQNLMNYGNWMHH